MALLVTHKRITAKISGRLSIDADIKPARFIDYCWMPAAHNEEHFILLFSMLVGIFEFDFLHIFSQVLLLL